jgi:hypothetical protein
MWVISPVFAGRSHIDERLFRIALGKGLIGESADLVVQTTRGHRIIRGRMFWHLARHLSTVRFPFVAAAIENLHLLVSEKAECPERVASPPVCLVAVENAGGVGRDPVAAAKRDESLRSDIVANKGVLKIGPPIDVDRAGNVPGVVEQDVLVGFDDADICVEVLLGQSAPTNTSGCVSVAIVFMVYPMNLPGSPASHLRSFGEINHSPTNQLVLHTICYDDFRDENCV